MKPSLGKLSQKLGYQFREIKLLQQALTHSSYGKNNNERLEFLGDSILGWVIAEVLYQRFPHAKEGQLSRLRAGLVKGTTLAQVALDFDLGRFMALGQGELKSGGYRRESILADGLEAVIGAIYLDSDIDTCRSRILAWFEGRLGKLSLTDNLKDAKTKLQEFCQGRQQTLPVYAIRATFGKEHEQIFEITCTLDLLATPVVGRGNSRRMAEQVAAQNALDALGE